MKNASRRKAASGNNRPATATSAKDKRRVYMLTPLAAAVMTALSPAGPALAQEIDETIDMIIVTATKRELNLQDVPHSIDVLTGDDMAKMGAKDLQATVRALPSVTLTALQPGQNVLVMRGVSNDPWEYYTEATVAVYLDEQPMTFSAQQVGFRSIDMARVENLPGPQGTLFGSSSQTGTIRYITNKPTTDGYSGQVEARYGTTKGGDSSYELSGVVNIPVSDSFAIRAVGYTSFDGGYVDNVLGTSLSGNYDNSDKVAQDYNEYEVDGGRIHALWNVNDNWSTLFTVAAENTIADGVWDSDDALGDYRVTRFEDEIRTDDWVTASVTLSGDLGFADLSFNYARFDRDIVYEYDNMTYRQWASAYYYNDYPFPLYNTDYYRSIIFNDQTQERDSLELRLVSKGDSRLQWMVGGYYEDILDKWFFGARTPGLENTTAWYYANAYAYLYGVNSNYYNNYTPNTNITYPLAPTDDNYVNNLDRSVAQTAFFGELSYDLTDDLTVHGGIRWAEYDRDVFEDYAIPAGLPPSGDRGDGDGSQRGVGKDSDTIYKFGLRYNFDDDVMVYGLFSQGFRVGGINSDRASRGGALPRNYRSDLMDNYELGIKSQWLDNRLTINASAFYMEWSDYQDSFGGDPWWVRGNVNVGDAETTGIEVAIDWQATDNLSIGANLFAANPEFSDNFCAIFVGGVDQGCPDNPTDDDLEVRKGMPMPNSPERTAHASIFYTIPDVLNGDLWLYYDFSYISETWNNRFNIVNNNTAGIAPSWTYSTLSAGLELQNQWDVELNVTNLFDENGYTYVGTWESDEAEYFGDPRYRRMRAQDRPRTVWLTVRKGFGNQ